MTEKPSFIWRIVSWMSKREVKTPLSFFFRTSGAVLILTALALYLIPDHRLAVYLYGISAMFVLTLVVALFAWLRPKNLVYGETGHRAETRLGLGTEHRIISQEEIATLEGTPNTAAIISATPSRNSLPTGGET